MTIEIDQSIKIADTKSPTAIAFSNGTQYSILIPAKVKRDCVIFLREYYNKPRETYMKLFAACVFLLVKDHLNKITTIIVDQEYKGHEQDIKLFLLNFIREAHPDFNKRAIIFDEIGKESGAHKEAIAVIRKNKKPNYIVKKEELIAVLKK